MSNKDLVTTGNRSAEVEFKPNKKQKLWLTAIAQSGKIRSAEQLSGLDHKTHYST